MPQIQASLITLKEQTTQREGNNWRERSEQKSENPKIRCSSRDEPLFEPNFGEDEEVAHSS